jgi:predicted O-methyltransferase YrrM
MRNLEEVFRELCATPSDINEHLATFVAMACMRDSRSRRIIELGVREGASTIAWLHAAEGLGHVWSVDVNFPSDASPLRSVDRSSWTFVLGRDDDPHVLAALPAECDVVFIDTSHTLEQTERELRLYAPRVVRGGFIFLHDTLENNADSNSPVRTAIERFCARAGLKWTEHRYNYGLGIIEVT